MVGVGQASENIYSTQWFSRGHWPLRMQGPAGLGVA